MRALALPFALLLAGVLAGSPARAELYVGLTADNELLGVNIEKAGEAGSLYVVLGAYQSATGYELDDLTGLIGYRRFQDGKYNANGYFGGIFLGDVDGGPSYNRFGLGGEVGYQWVTTHLRLTLHGGMAIADAASGDTGPSGAQDVEPVPLFGASASLRF